MPFIYATAHRKEGQPPLRIEQFMPTHMEPEEQPQGDAAAWAMFASAMQVQIRIGDERTKRHGQPS